MKFTSLKGFVCSVLVSALTLPMAVGATGFGFDKNRLVIQDGKLSGSFTLKNDNDSAMLIRAHVEDFDQLLTKQAQARPRLFQVKAEGTARIRVDVNPKGLPTDRETQFWLYTKAFPAVDLTKDTNQIQINFVTRLKVFYRPEGLNANMEEAAAGLTWGLKNGRLVVDNPSPLNVTIIALINGGKKHAVSHVIKPFSQWVTNMKAVPGKLRWQSINDFGGPIEYEATIR